MNSGFALGPLGVCLVAILLAVMASRNGSGSRRRRFGRTFGLGAVALMVAVVFVGRHVPRELSAPRLQVASSVTPAVHVSESSIDPPNAPSVSEAPKSARKHHNSNARARGIDNTTALVIRVSVLMGMFGMIYMFLDGGRHARYTGFVRISSAVAFVGLVLLYWSQIGPLLPAPPN